MSLDPITAPALRVGDADREHAVTALGRHLSVGRLTMAEFENRVDTVYAAATRTYGAAVWNDVRDGANCPAIDVWRASVQTATTADDVPRPAPQRDCPATFGNTDIFGWTSAP